MHLHQSRTLSCSIGGSQQIEENLPPMSILPMSSRMCLRALYYEDWRKPYIDCISFLDQKILPSETKDVVGIKKRAFRFFAKQGELYRKGYNGHPLHPDVQQVLEEAHAPGHIGGAKIYDHLMTLGYYWPTMEIDSATFVKRCKVCQLHGNLIHAPAVELPTHFKLVPSISSGK